MEIENKSLINKLLESQFYTVFQKMDKDNKDSLDFEQFSTFLYAIGLDFINQFY